MTPLMKAVEAASENAVYFLLENRVDPKLVDNRGRSAVEYAKAYYPQTEIIDLLKQAIDEK